jgi:NAD(P)-dependent dehydrogenase (short-subunit alcohol dehydrogenase family)
MNNRVALITGGATGIGRATALILAGRGVNVVISGRRESLGQKLVEEIRANGGQAAFIVASVDDETEVRRTIEFAVTKYGRLDLVDRRLLCVVRSTWSPWHRASGEGEKGGAEA